MFKLKLQQISSLEKVFLDFKGDCEQLKKCSMLKGEELSYQIAYSCNTDEYSKIPTKLTVVSPIAEYVTIRNVANVPSEFPAYPGRADDGYITTKSGLFPDPLMPITDGEIEVLPSMYRSLWVSVNIPENFKSGCYFVEIVFQCQNNGSASVVCEIEVIDAVLPAQETIVTQWLHTDCIATVENVEMFSDAHWTLIEKYIKTATNNGINMILTPIFTPPLDTMVGGERPTVQLVGVTKVDNKYTFDFSKLVKFINICKKCDVKYYEMSHLFTQWGAKHTPKIEVMENGEMKKMFGWHVEAGSQLYKDFLQQFLPQLTKVLENENINKNTYFHVSDEPSEQHFETYKTAKDIVADYLKDYKIMDALSHVELYQNGLVQNPVPSNDKFQEFWEENIAERWVYYCCGQGIDVSNRFMAMPSSRNRIMGAQMYKFDVKGFLQWGYNFYYSQFSKGKIDPFLVTDAGCGFPSGDPFSVYPYKGEVVESLRLKVFKDALQDIRAMKLLESFIGKEKVVEIIEEDLDCKLEFNKFPFWGNYTLNLRNKINQQIKSYCK